MDSLRALLTRVRALFGRAKLEQGLDAEMRSHLEMLAEENLRRGMSAEEGLYSARREFGGIEQTKEAFREQRGIPFVENLIKDARYGARLLRKSPGFAVVAVLTLALGIAVNTVVFTAFNALALRSLPVKEPER